ncbi:MAG: VOC family protein [Microscillaceae bacterium]|nr:VOC family protein [Microscillaceae bacterium]
MSENRLFLSQTLRAQASVGYKNPVISIGVVVEDMNKSLDFYTRVMGMKKTSGFDLNADFSQRSGLTRGIPFTVVVLKLEDSPQATEWKLMSFGKKGKPNRSKHIEDDLGMQYITLYVNALSPFLERFKANKVNVFSETPTPIGENKYLILLQDPDGIFIELIGPL